MITIQPNTKQEKADNEEQPNEKKKALTEIIAAYNERFNTNHRLAEFDSYYLRRSSPVFTSQTSRIYEFSLGTIKPAKSKT